MDIITKFIIATDEGKGVILSLTRELAKEKFSSILEQKILEEYIDKHFNKKQLVAEMNDLSNQWLVVYVDNNPAGYAKITSKGEKPRSLENKRAARIADLAILTKYPEVEVKHSLLDKCLLVCKHHEGIWINEYAANPLIDFFESKGFERQPEASRLDDLALPSVYLVYFNDTGKK
ncbi:N-acetyltransferase [Chitinophaga sp.]|uniref:N-acetyltransferase n=1 Tax=Chitinophaga sp. TaxID=1869181 RepID=UPI0031DC8862